MEACVKLLQIEQAEHMGHCKLGLRLEGSCRSQWLMLSAGVQRGVHTSPSPPHL